MISKLAFIKKIQQTASPPAPRRNIPTEIYIDNDGSDRATIIDIRVPDRVGLLYTISDQFYQLGLDICIAKISTEKFWAIDSFYVTEKDGTKITHPERIKTVQQTLAARLES
jgi:[protein-PII] uridylyltransferase